MVKELANIETSFLPFYFNAWENDYVEDPVIALLSNMASSFDQESSVKERLPEKCITSVIDAALAISPFSIRTSEVAEAFSGDNLVKSYTKRRSLRMKINELAEESIVEVANKLVIFIDELDRCRPDFAVRLLEQTKSLFQSKDIVVVISADSLQLANATEGLYGPRFNSQHFIERFFDQRMTLGPVDAYKVATGSPLQDTFDDYSRMAQELFSSRQLTIRDCARIHDKITAGHVYCEKHDDGSTVSYVANNLFIPILIFLEREDIEIFRRITRGADTNAIYDYGSRCSCFVEVLDRAITREKRGFSPETMPSVTEEDRRRFVHNVCLLLFSAKRGGAEWCEAQRQIGYPRGLDYCVYKTLRFSEQGERI